jgi:hypothetical protein
MIWEHGSSMALLWVFMSPSFSWRYQATKQVSTRR